MPDTIDQHFGFYLLASEIEHDLLGPFEHRVVKKLFCVNKSGALSRLNQIALLFVVVASTRREIDLDAIVLRQCFDVDGLAIFGG